jgi:hypothetical protein
VKLALRLEGKPATEVAAAVAGAKLATSAAVVAAREYPKKRAVLHNAHERENMTAVQR